MNKQDLVEVLSARLQKSQKEAAETIDAFVDEIKKALAKGEAIRISGFGAFEQSVRSARQGRNPRTGEAVRIQATKVVKFRPAADFKAIVAGARKAVADAVPGGETAPEDAPAPAKKAAAPRKSSASKTTAAAKKAPAAKKTTAAAKKTTTAAAKTTTAAAKTTTAAAKTTTAAAKKATTTAKKATTAATATTAKKAAPRKTAAKKTAAPPAESPAVEG